MKGHKETASPFDEGIWGGWMSSLEDDNVRAVADVVGKLEISHTGHIAVKLIVPTCNPRQLPAAT